MKKRGRDRKKGLSEVAVSERREKKKKRWCFFEKQGPNGREVGADGGSGKRRQAEIRRRKNAPGNPRKASKKKSSPPLVCHGPGAAKGGEKTHLGVGRNASDQQSEIGQEVRACQKSFTKENLKGVLIENFRVQSSRGVFKRGIKIKRNW